MTNILQRTAQERDERVKNLKQILPIPSWDGALVAQYEVLSRKLVEEFSTRKPSVQGNMDFVLRCCTALYLRDPEGELGGTALDEEGYEGYVRIEDDHGLPVTFDQTLAEKLGMENPDKLKARDVLAYCFKDNYIAINTVSAKLMQWMTDTDQEIAKNLLGE